MAITIYEGTIAGIYTSNPGSCFYAFDVDLVDTDDPAQPSFRKVFHTDWLDPSERHLALPGCRLYYMEERSSPYSLTGSSITLIPPPGRRRLPTWVVAPGALKITWDD